MVTGELWPAHPHPYRDELSSWLVRVAHANGLKVQTFCAQEFGTEHQLWNRGIDRLAPAWLIESWSAKTGVPLKRAWETTLLGYGGNYTTSTTRPGSCVGCCRYRYTIGNGEDMVCNFAQRAWQRDVSLTIEDPGVWRFTLFAQSML